jgi:hypothetical protein
MASGQKIIKPTGDINIPIIDKPNKELNCHQLFNLLFLGSILSSLTLVGLFNFLVNPYGIFQSPLIPKFNVYKIEKENYDRLYKTADVIRLKPKTIILGSSRAKRGINPDYQGVKTDQPAYNLALNNLNMHELVEYFKYAIKNQPDLRTVIIGLDLFMFNDYLKSPPTYNHKRLSQNHLAWFDIINSLFSINALSISKDTVLANMDEKSISKLIPNSKGFIPTRPTKDGRMLIRTEGLLSQYYKDYPHYRLSQQYLADFRELVEICHKNNIELKVFFSPAHSLQLEADAKIYGWSTLENLKREIVKITPFWDFSGYNSITGEPLAQNMNYYSDSSHYFPLVGNRVIDRLFNPQSKTIPADFGVLINADNIEDHLAKIRRDRERWKKSQRIPKQECVLCDKFF